MEFTPDHLLITGAAKTPLLLSSSVAEKSSKLPKHIILKSTNTGLYLRYMDKHSSHLGFSDDYNISPKLKFEVVQSTLDSGYVSIKSCYNNKYWDCHEDTGHVTATASEPVEHCTNIVYCTLFRPVYGDIDASGNKTLRLLHGGAQKYIKAQSSGEHLLELSDDGKGDLLTVIDWKTIVILPKRLVFKGQNGKYLRAFTSRSTNYVAFESEKKNYDLEAHEITQRPDGTISIRNEHFDGFWRPESTSQWVYVDGASAGTRGTHFKPVLLGTNTEISLQSLQNKNFCTYNSTANISFLIAGSNIINEYSHMTIEEPVVSRVIDNVKYRMDDARKLDETTAFADSDHILNTTDHPKNKFTKVITLADTNSNTWDYISSVKIGMSTTLKTGIPIIVNGEIKISAEIGKSYKWGGVDKEETEIGGKLTANVPPKCKLTVNLTYTKGTCEVPFSYLQHDTLTNGVLKTTEMEGGIFTGTNCYNFTFETVQTAL